MTSYDWRHLTLQSDRLNAVSGILKVLSETQNDRFHWGLPEKFFSNALKWHYLGSCSRNYESTTFILPDGSSQRVRFPSWSWLAWKGEIELATLSWIFGQNDDDCMLAREPKVDFELCGLDRAFSIVREEIHSVGQLKPEELESRMMGLQKRRAESPMMVESRSIPSTIGVLRFRTEIATMQLSKYKYEREGGSYYNVLPLNPTIQIGLEGGLAYYFPNDRGREACDNKVPSEESDIDPEQITCVDFAIFAQSRPDVYAAMALEWIDGIAYRLGYIDIREDDWEKLDNRRTEVVHLG